MSWMSIRAVAMILALTFEKMKCLNVCPNSAISAWSWRSISSNIVNSLGETYCRRSLVNFTRVSNGFDGFPL